MLMKTLVDSLLSRGVAAPDFRLVVGGPCHGEVHRWDHDTICVREPQKFRLNVDEILYYVMQPPTHKYYEVRSYDEDAHDKHGDLEICTSYFHESINIKNRKVQALAGELAFICWVLGIGFPKMNGFFSVISHGKYYSFDTNDKWAVWAGLGHYDVVPIVKRLETVLKSIVEKT